MPSESTSCEWCYWLDFDRGANSACVHNIHKPEWRLPAANFVSRGRYADLKVPLPGGEAVFKHERFERQGEPLHLFFAVIQDYPTLGATSSQDWTASGRLQAAWAGRRSVRSEIIHMLVSHPYSQREARDAARGYLEKLLKN